MTTPSSSDNTFDRIRAIATKYKVPFDVVGAAASTPVERYVAQLVCELATVEGQLLRAIRRLRDDLDDAVYFIESGAGHVSGSGVTQESGGVDTYLAKVSALRSQLTQAVAMLTAQGA